jgi:putative ABC transport system permease protein
MESVIHDVRYALRSLRKSPGFAATVILTLGIAIGVNTAVFTVSNAVLFKGFRFIEHNDRILYVGTQNKGRGCCASFPDIADWRSQTRSFTDMAAVADEQIAIQDESGAAQHYDATRVTTNSFRLLGLTPMLGRDFSEEDGRAGAAPVAILRYEFWERRYGNDPSVIGRAIKISGTPTTVIGVMPQGFSFPQNEDVWLPLVPTGDLQRRDNRSLWFAFGRLAKAATIDTARAELATIGRGLAQAYPRTNEGWMPQPRTFAEFFVGSDASVIYGTLWGAVGFVVLVACANLANLVLSRGLDRAREQSVMAALGASRWQIIRQPLTESVILTVAGGTLGWWIARVCVRTYELTANPPGRSWSAHLFDYGMDGRVLGYVLLMSAATTVLFGLAPSVFLSRLNASAALQDARRSVTGSRRSRRLSTALVIAEVAVAVVLLAGAGVLVRSFLNIARADLGVRTANRSAMMVYLPAERYREADAQTRFFDQLSARLSGATDIESVAMTSELPAANGRRIGYELDGDAPVDVEHRKMVSTFTISPAYFDTIGAPMVSGRDFTRFDTASQPAIAIVNRKFADLHWPGADPVGKRLRMFDGGKRGPLLTVVGVAANIVQNVTDRQERDPLVYRPFLQRPAPSAWFVARTRSDAASVAAVFRREMQALDPDVPIWIGPMPLDMLITAMGNYWQLGSETVMFAVFGVIALLLASIGIYAVIAYSVGRRTKEIGIRIALGATARDVLRLILTQSAWPLAIGCAVGLLASLAVIPALKSQLVHVSPADPVTLIAVSCLLITCGLVGCVLPAYRAMRIGPAVALRHD